MTVGVSLDAQLVSLGFAIESELATQHVEQLGELTSKQSLPNDDEEVVQDDMQSSVIERGLASYAWSMDDSYVWVTGSADDYAEEPSPSPAMVDSNVWDDDFVDDFDVEQQDNDCETERQDDADCDDQGLVQSLSFSEPEFLGQEEEVQEQPVDDQSHFLVDPSASLPVTAGSSERIIVKLYLDEGNIHRFSFERDQLSFERLQERVAHNLVQRADSPAECRAYAVTYEDDEGDRIAVCSQEELCEALRVHEECLWPALCDGEQPILRLHVRPVALGPALSNGYIFA